MQTPASLILMLGAWFGLICGSVEACLFLLLRELDFMSLRGALLPISIRILWVSPTFNLLLFTCTGLLLVVGGKALPQLAAPRSVVALFSLMTFFNWLAPTALIQHAAILVLAIGFAAVFTRWFKRNEVRFLGFSRKTLPWVVSTIAVILVLVESSAWLLEKQALARLPQAPQLSPNVLVIVVDSLRADHLSCYGYPRDTSPNLDGLAAHGVLFESAFATSSWSLPSHASLLTGRYPFAHGATTHSMADPHPTIAEAFLARGYRTAAFSANQTYFARHNGFGRGFTRFEDYMHSLHDMATRTLYWRKFDQIVLRRLGFEDLPARRRAADINAALLRWVNRDRARPFFAFLNYFDAHDPYLPPQPYRAKYSASGTPGGKVNGLMLRYIPELTAEELQSEVDAYDGAISYVDEQISRLIQELQMLQSDRELVVVVTSDHGESFGEHGLLNHSHSLYREVIHVPLILWGPGRVPSGIRMPTPVTNAALASTLIHLVGSGEAAFPIPSLLTLRPGRGDLAPPISEVSQMKFLAGQRPSPSGQGWLKSIIREKWHLIVHEELPPELYDWVADPKEEEDMAGRRPETVRSLLQSLCARVNERTDLPAPGKEKDPTEQSFRRRCWQLVEVRPAVPSEGAIGAKLR